jgi:kynureninase
LYIRYVDVWDAVEQLRDILDSGSWNEEQYRKRAAVT